MEDTNMVYSINTVYGNYESGITVYRLSGNFSGWYKVVDYTSGNTCITSTKTTAIEIADAIAKNVVRNHSLNA